MQSLRYYHNDDSEYRGIKNIEDLFRLSISEDYYKPTLVKIGYSGNYTKYESKGDKILTFEEYLSMIEPYLAGMINDYKSKGEWKVQLIAEIKTLMKHVLCILKVIMLKLGLVMIRVMLLTNVLNLFCKDIKKFYKKKMRGSDFELDGINLLYYDFNKISLNRGGSYIESAKWIKDKKIDNKPK